MPITYDSIEDIDELAVGYMEAIESEKNSLWQRADIAMQARKINKLRELADKTGQNYNSLQNISSVAQTYEPVNRIFDLSFEHYKTVMGSDNRFDLLEKAEKGKWSVDDLRRKRYEDEPKPIKPDVKKKGRPAKEIPLLEVRAQIQNPIIVAQEESISIADLLFVAKWCANEKPWLWEKVKMTEFMSLLLMSKDLLVEYDPIIKEFYTTKGTYMGENYSKENAKFVPPVTADVV